MTGSLERRGVSGGALGKQANESSNITSLKLETEDQKHEIFMYIGL